MIKTLSVLLLAGLIPGWCHHFPPGGGGTGGSAGTAGTGGTGGTTCESAVVLTYTTVGGDCGDFEPEDFVWPTETPDACDATWQRDEQTCEVTLDTTCEYEDVNVAPGVYQDELYVQEFDFAMVDEGTGTAYLEVHINGELFCTGSYTIVVSAQ